MQLIRLTHTLWRSHSLPRSHPQLDHSTVRTGHTHRHYKSPSEHPHPHASVHKPPTPAARRPNPALVLGGWRWEEPARSRVSGLGSLSDRGGGECEPRRTPWHAGEGVPGPGLDRVPKGCGRRQLWPEPPPTPPHERAGACGTCACRDPADRPRGPPSAPTGAWDRLAGARLAEGRGSLSVRVRVQAWRPEWVGGSREEGAAGRTKEREGRWEQAGGWRGERREEGARRRAQEKGPGRPEVAGPARSLRPPGAAPPPAGPRRASSSPQLARVLPAPRLCSRAPAPAPRRER